MLHQCGPHLHGPVSHRPRPRTKRRRQQTKSEIEQRQEVHEFC